MGQLISELSHFNLGMEIEKIEQVVSEILVREFTDSHGKQNVFRCGNRLNFSCPYCGDSHDSRKKRGNFYLDTLAYKCYNGGCGVFKDLISFFKDFGAYNRLSNDDKNEVKSILKMTSMMF